MCNGEKRAACRHHLLKEGFLPQLQECFETGHGSQESWLTYHFTGVSALVCAQSKASNQDSTGSTLKSAEEAQYLFHKPGVVSEKLVDDTGYHHYVRGGQADCSHVLIWLLLSFAGEVDHIELQDVLDGVSKPVKTLGLHTEEEDQSTLLHFD